MGNLPLSASRRPGPPAGALASLAFASAALCLAGCLQPEPDDDALEPDIAIPQDDGKVAGATSSTNWPAELVNDKYRAEWSADSSLRIRFRHLPPIFPPVDQPMSLRGSVRIYPGGAIPSLDSVPSTSRSFEATDSLEIPFDWFPATSSASKDTISFNIHLDLDSLHGMLFGMRYVRPSGRFVAPAGSDLTGKTIVLDSLKHYFRGATDEVTSLLPTPIGDRQSISFYIPGTPMYCHAQSDSFLVGPLPKGKYPLRILRLDGSGNTGGETAIEAWELLVSDVGTSSKFSLGEQVLSSRVRGTPALREGR